MVIVCTQVGVFVFSHPQVQLNFRPLGRRAQTPHLLHHDLGHELVISENAGLECIEDELAAVVHIRSLFLIRSLQHVLRRVLPEFSLLEVDLGALEVELDADQQRHIAERDRGVHLIGQDLPRGLERLVVHRVDVLHLALEAESRRVVGLGASRQHKACSRD